MTLAAMNKKYSFTPFCFHFNEDETVDILHGFNPRDYITTVATSTLVQWLQENTSRAFDQRRVADLERATEASAMLADLGI